MSETQTQVLIIGGGIVGLSASLFLTHHSIPHILIERHPNTSLHPRARSVNARTMELYRSLSISSAVREAGASLAPAKGIYKGSSLSSVISPHKRTSTSTTNEPKKFPLAEYFEYLSPTEGARGTQDMIEPVLLTAARDRGGDLRFNTELLSFSQTPNNVTATVRNRSTFSEYQIHAEYMIAADGANSSIRHQLGVGTTGKGELGYLLNILFEADLRDFVRGREFSMCYVENEGVRGLFTSIDNSDRWVFHLSYEPDKGQKREDFTKEICEELIQAALGMEGVEVQVISVLPWEPTVRVAQQFRHGRIFLAGDAAHQMPPWGGQGANSGIADVHNLSWKLAAVLNNQASPELLNTYNTERLPVGKLCAEESGAAADEWGLIDWSMRPEKVLGLLRKLPRLGGYRYCYRSQAINTEDSTPFIWRQRWLTHMVPWICSLDGSPGTRAPHLWVQYKGEKISTLDLFGKDFVLLAGGEGRPWCEIAEKASKTVGVDVKAYCAGSEGGLVCGTGEWEAMAGISAKGVLLVRPDGFVAWRVWGQPVGVEQKLKDVLMQVLCRWIEGVP